MNQALLNPSQSKDDLERNISQTSDDEIVYAIIVKNRKKKVVDHAKKHYSLHKFLNYVVKTAPEGRRTSFKYKEELIFHVLSEFPYMYLCVSNVNFSIEKAFMFINEIKAHFLEQDVKQFIQDREGTTKKFQDFIRDQMNSYNTTYKTKLEEARYTLSDAEKIVSENIDKIIEKDSKISSSMKMITDSQINQNRSSVMIDRSINESYRKLSFVRKQQKSNRNRILFFIASIFIALIIFIVALYSCGGFSFSACS